MRPGKLLGLRVAVFAVWVATGGAEPRGDPDDWDRRAREAGRKYMSGEIAAAMAEWRQLAKDAERFDPLDRRRTLVLHNVGALHVELGQPLEAIGYLEEAARRMERAPHPGLNEAKTMNYLAMAYVDTGDYAKAERMLRAVREKSLARAERGGSELTMADLLGSQILLERGRKEEAEAMVRAALRRVEERGRPAPEEEQSLWNQLGTILSSRRRWSEAEEAYRRAVESLSREMGDGHPRTAKARINLAGALVRSGKAEEAEEMAGEAERALTATLGAGHWAVGAALERRAVALRALKRGKEAKELEKRAGRIRTAYEKDNLLGSKVDLEALAYRRGR